jgi:OTT_1508-like deaminase
MLRLQDGRIAGDYFPTLQKLLKEKKVQEAFWSGAGSPPPIVDHLSSLASCFRQEPADQLKAVSLICCISAITSGKNQMIDLICDVKLASQIWDSICRVSRAFRVTGMIHGTMDHFAYFASLTVTFLSNPTATKCLIEDSGEEEELDFETDSDHENDTEDAEEMELKTLATTMAYLDLEFKQENVHTFIKEKATLRETEMELAKRLTLHATAHPEAQIMSYLIKEDLMGKMNRYISSSKNACFMCNLFCHSLGVETRGCDYDQYSVWKLPLADRLSSTQVAKLVQSLIETNQSLKEQLCTRIAHPVYLVKSTDNTKNVGSDSVEVTTSKLTTAGKEKLDPETEKFLAESVIATPCIVAQLANSLTCSASCLCRLETHQTLLQMLVEADHSTPWSSQTPLHIDYTSTVVRTKCPPIHLSWKTMASIAAHLPRKLCC